MKTQDRLVLRALSTDRAALLLCWKNSWITRQTLECESPLVPIIPSFDDEFRALEMFVEETTFWSYARFNPNI